MGGKDGDVFSPYIPPLTQRHIIEWTLSSGVKGLDCTSSIPTFQVPLDGQGTKYLALKANEICICEQIFQQRLCRLQGRGMIYSSAERKKLPTKNILPNKVALQNWKRDKDISRQTKAERIHHHQMKLTRNIKESSWSWNKRMIITKMKTYENIKLTGKGKYIVKFRML